MWHAPWMRARLGALGNVVETDPRSGIRWVLIPAGSIKTMRGKVLTVSRPFLMAETPVTQEQWMRVMSGPGLPLNNPSRFKGDPRRPVETVSAKESDDFAKRVGGRLPTEDEWEYAALGGRPQDPYGQILDIAWVYENSGGETHPVGQKLPNAFGLYDMLGNVWHWTSSQEGAKRVFSGGSWVLPAVLVRGSHRDYITPDFRFWDLGFRPVKDLPSSYGKTRIELLEIDETGELPRTPGDSARVRMIELDGLKRRR